jgi:hypothetical protein
MDCTAFAAVHRAQQTAGDATAAAAIAGTAWQNAGYAYERWVAAAEADDVPRANSLAREIRIAFDQVYQAADRATEAERAAIAAARDCTAAVLQFHPCQNCCAYCREHTDPSALTYGARLCPHGINHVGPSRCSCKTNCNNPKPAPPVLVDFRCSSCCRKCGHFGELEESECDCVHAPGFRMCTWREFCPDRPGL